MVEKIGTIKNPLTIIAIFAAISEISGTVILPFITPQNQGVYVWFLIFFPIILILLFFSTLNFNHRVLYAPSDYKDEQNFLDGFGRATYIDRIEKATIELNESPEIATPPQPPTQPEARDSATMASGSPSIAAGQIDRKEGSTESRALELYSRQRRYFIAEDLVFQRLDSEFASPIQRSVKIKDKYVLDGLSYENGIATAIEVRLISGRFIPASVIQRSLDRIHEAAQFALFEKNKFRVLFALVIDSDDFDYERMAIKTSNIQSLYTFPIEFRYFKMKDLEDRNIELQ